MGKSHVLATMEVMDMGSNAAREHTGDDVSVLQTGEVASDLASATLGIRKGVRVIVAPSKGIRARVAGRPVLLVHKEDVLGIAPSTPEVSS